MSYVYLKEPTLTIPVHYVWIVEAKTYNECQQSLESPHFGSNGHFDTTVKFRLHLNRVQKMDKISLEIVSSDLQQLEVQYHISHQSSNLNNNNNFTKIALGTKYQIWSTNYPQSNATTSRLIRCDLVYLKPFQSALKYLSTDFGVLRKNLQFTDVIFHIGIKEFPAHKNILSTRSPVFKTMFGNKDFVENQKNRIEIIDMTPEVLEGLLDFVYTGQVEKLTELASDLLLTAHKYQIESLVQVCELNMSNNITVDNGAKYLILAELYNLPVLKRETVKFINENANSVMKSDGWKTLIDDNLALLRELYKAMAIDKK